MQSKKEVGTRRFSGYKNGTICPLVTSRGGKQTAHLPRFHINVISYRVSFTQPTICSEKHYAAECLARSEPGQVIAASKSCCAW